MAEQDVVKFLEAVGCCRRCLLIFLGDRTDSSYGTLQEINEKIKSYLASECTNNEESVVRSSSEVEEKDARLPPTSARRVEQEAAAGGDDGALNNGTSQHTSKRLRGCVCPTCLGLLQWGCSPDAITKLCDAVAGSGHDAEAFTLALLMPISLSLRVHRVWTLLHHTFPNFPTKGREDHVGTVKDVWKNLVGPKMESSLAKKFIHGAYLDFVLNVTTSYDADIEDCKIMDQLCGAMFEVRQKQHRKYAGGVYTKQAIEAAIRKVSDEDFVRICPEPPLSPDEGVVFSSLECKQAPLYMAGRYNKYSRDLPQTPWFVEGERKLESSVQELLCGTLNKAVMAEDIKFSSSGREDVDVRCLGNGRPFVVEFINPRHTRLTSLDITALQKSINTSTSLIHLRDLQIVDKKDVKNLKEGEEEKTKAYCALCIAQRGYEPAALHRLAHMREVTVQQKTPLRVLHRRSLATRPRVIHSMTAVPLNHHFFKLRLTTQAGTYIKEFIHGDLGRTTPNLAQILAVDLDIIALDVENVALDWPPKCDE